MKKLNLFTTLGAVVVMFSLTACGSKLTPENFAKIQKEQSEEEVIRILGKPTKVESGSFLGVTGTTYLYQVKENDKEKEARVSFVNGKVFAKEGEL